jgi:hypothetical protein
MSSDPTQPRRRLRLNLPAELRPPQSEGAGSPTPPERRAPRLRLPTHPPPQGSLSPLGDILTVIVEVAEPGSKLEIGGRVEHPR